MVDTRQFRIRLLCTTCKTLGWLLFLLPFCGADLTATAKAGESGADAAWLRSADIREAKQAVPSVTASDSVIRFGPGSTWSATTHTGRILGGTWSCVIDPTTGAASGTWTLRDGENKILLRGTWSVSKTADEWRGTWRGLVDGQTGQQSGTWAASVNLPPDAPLAGMFEQAVRQLVSGTWQSRSQSGTWSIRSVPIKSNRSGSSR
ncbi:MAG: hypothetical protein ACM34H_02275 [Deltaproteobacteria bacterium]